MKYIITISLCFLGIVGLFAQDVEKKISIKKDSIEYYQKMLSRLESEMEELKLEQLRQNLKNWALPKLESGDEVIEHSAMSLVYSEEHEQAKWVAHIITSDIRNSAHGRSNDFREDEKVKTGTAVEKDYFLKYEQEDGTFEYDGFGYDRGHLAPSADFSWSAQALSESYYYSNMSPMRPEFNRGQWAKLEDAFRAYIYRHPDTELYVVTGPVLKDGLPTVPRATNNLSIPEQYFKVAIDMKYQRAIAFLMPNREIEEPIENFAVSIDEVEALTGFDFYHNLDDLKENVLEKQADPIPFLSIREQQDVLPIPLTELPNKCYNTSMAKKQVGKGREIKVMGTVVSTKLSSKGNVFLNLDKSFPNQVFTVSIFKDRLTNFTYEPHEHLKGKVIIVKGKVTNFNGTPSMVIENEKGIEIME